MEAYQDEDELFEEDVVFDHAGLLDSNAKTKTAIRRISTGKCAQFAKTLGLCGAFFGLGLCMAIPIPGILDPADQSMAPHTSIYTSRASGYLVGSCIGGVLFDRFNRLFLLFISLLLTSLFITVTPWCKILWLLKAIMVILGILMGFLDTGCNVLCLDLWGRNSGPFMQALHFSFGLGVFIAPMLSAPFLEVIQLNVSSEVNSSFPQNLHISDLHAEKLLKRVLNVDDFKDNPFIRGERDLSHLNTSLLFSGLDLGEVWSTSVSQANASFVTSNTEDPKSSSPSAIVKMHLNQSDIGFLAENDTLATSVDYLASEVDVSTEYTNSTQAPSLHTTPRIPKPKPSFTDAGKLDHTKDWDKIPVRKPPPELVAPPSVTAKSVSQIPSSVAQTTPSSVSLNASLSIPSSNITSKNYSVPVANMTAPKSNQSEPLAPSMVKSNTSDEKIGEMSDIRVGSEIGLIAQKENNETLHSTEIVAHEKVNKTIIHQSVSKENSTSATVEPRSSQPSAADNPKVNVSKVNSSPPSGENKTQTPTEMTQKSTFAQNKPFTPAKGNILDQTKRNFSDENGRDEHVMESPQQSAYKASNSSVEKESVARNSEYYGNELEPKAEKVVTSNVASNPTLNVVHITVHEIDKIFQDNDSKVSNAHENSFIANNKSSNESQATFSKLYTSEIPPKHEHHFKPGTYDNDTEDISTLFDVLANRIEKYGFNKIQFTYLIVGMFVFSISLVFLGFLCHNPRDPKSKQEDGVERYKISRKFLWGSLVSCMSLFFFFNMGMEVTFGRYLLTFVVHSDLNLSRSTGSCVTALFWGSFAAMRFASIFCASGFSPTSMLIFNFIMCSLGSIILTTLSNEVETALWLGTSFLGIGLASMFPTGILWVERYIHVSNKVAALFVMGVALGEIIFPLIAQYLMQSNQLMLMHMAAVANALCICTFVMLWCLVAHHGEKYVSVGNVGYQLASQHDEEEDMVELSPSSGSAGMRNHGSPNELGLLLNGHSTYEH